MELKHQSDNSGFSRHFNVSPFYAVPSYWRQQAGLDLFCYFLNQSVPKKLGGKKVNRKQSNTDKALQSKQLNL